MSVDLYVIFHRVRQAYWCGGGVGEDPWTRNPDSASRFRFRDAARLRNSFSGRVRANLTIKPVTSLPTYTEQP